MWLSFNSASSCSFNGILLLDIVGTDSLDDVILLARVVVGGEVLADFLLARVVVGGDELVGILEQVVVQ